MSNIINLKQTRKNIENSLELINEGSPLRDRLRFQHIHTLSKIIYIQSLRLSHLASLGVLNGSDLKAENIACNKPKCYLAKCAQVTSKTIQNHLRRLEEKQLIKRVNKRGKLLILVHPLLLSIDEKHTEIQRVLWENFKSINPKIDSDLGKGQEQTLPTNHISGNFKSIITSDVENSKSPSHDATDTNFQETQEARHPQKKSTQEAPHKLSNSESFRKQNCGGRDAAEQRFVERQVFTIWEWCMQNLYHDREYIANSQYEYAIDFLTKSFDRKHGAAVYTHISHLRTRLNKWKKFVSRSGKTERFTPLPMTFFDPDNIHGFAKTELWIKEDENKKRYNHVWKQARQIERTALRILVGQFPEKRRNPINQMMETHYRPLTIQERLTELNKLEYRVNRVSEKFPNINKWFRNSLQNIIEITNGQIA